MRFLWQMIKPKKLTQSFRILDNCFLRCPNTVRPVHMLTPLTYVHIGEGAKKRCLLLQKLCAFASLRRIF